MCARLHNLEGRTVLITQYRVSFFTIAANQTLEIIVCHHSLFFSMKINPLVISVRIMETLLFLMLAIP